MGERGPPATPTAILALRGSKHLADRKHEVRAPKRRPRCPAHLSKESRAAWRRVVKHLDGLGVLSEADEGAIERYACTVVLWRRCQAFVEEFGVQAPVLDTEGRQVSMRAYPAARLITSFADQCLKLERQFGLTPSARASIAIAVDLASRDVESPDDAAGRLFARRTGGA